jgi:hypothetical protein
MWVKNFRLIDYSLFYVPLKNISLICSYDVIAYFTIVTIMLLDFWLPYPESYHSQLIEKDSERSKSILINDIITKHRASCSRIWHCHWRLLKTGLETQERGSVCWEYLRMHRTLVYFQNINMQTQFKGCNHENFIFIVYHYVLCMVAVRSGCFQI